jgi:hypothetical protein
VAYKSRCNETCLSGHKENGMNMPETVRIKLLKACGFRVSENGTQNYI